jgi:hypothetical protein
VKSLKPDKDGRLPSRRADHPLRAYPRTGVVEAASRRFSAHGFHGQQNTDPKRRDAASTLMALPRVVLAFTVEFHLRFGKAKDTPQAHAAATTVLCFLALTEIFMVLAGFLGLITSRGRRKARKEAWRKATAIEPDSEEEAIEFQNRLRKRTATKL